MVNKKHKDSSKPAGYFLFSWLQARNSVQWIIFSLLGSCAILFGIDFFYHRHGHFEIEEWPGFFAVYGFIMFSAIIFGAKALRFFIKRPENYYGDKAVDSENQKGDH
ncbi:MAG: hypothetical protein VYE27_03060 [Pseudomonadota bacterium]|nr:hypothetical protein [Pseudomonadota bacterium]